MTREAVDLDALEALVAEPLCWSPTSDKALAIEARRVIPSLIAEIRELRGALVAMADGAEIVGEHYQIVQPLLAIYRSHGETIAKARAAPTGER